MFLLIKHGYRTTVESNFVFKMMMTILACNVWHQLIASTTSHPPPLFMFPFEKKKIEDYDHEMWLVCMIENMGCK